MNDDELDSLLAKGALSGPERDRVFERVWEAVRPPSPVARWRYGVAIAAGVAAVVTIGVVRRPVSTFSARGGSAAVPAVELDCSGGTAKACPRGSRLVFRSDTPGYLAAYAQPVGGGERIWYFSAEAIAPQVGGPSAPERPADHAVLVGQEHSLGTYDVHVFVGTRPLSVADAIEPKSPPVVASQILRLTVTP